MAEIQKILKLETDYLIGLVDQLEYMISTIIKSNHRLDSVNFGNSQVRNLLAGAKQASGIKEMILYIQYQMGRDEYRNSWRRPFNGNYENLGEAVIDSLKNIENRLKTYQLEDKEMEHKTLIGLMERYFLFWSWKYTYLAASAKSGPDRGAPTNQQGQRQYANNNQQRKPNTNQQRPQGGYRR